MGLVEFEFEWRLPRKEAHSGFFETANPVSRCSVVPFQVRWNVANRVWTLTSSPVREECVHLRGVGVHGSCSCSFLRDFLTLAEL